MGKRLFYLACFMLLGICLLYTNICISQDTLTTWQKQLNFLQTNLYHENFGDANDLKIIGYTYKGKIGSECNKSQIINSMLSFDTPTILHLPSVIIRDTIVRGDSCIIKEREFPKFEIIPIQQMIEIAKSRGKENPFIQTKKLLDDLIKLDFEYLELEWNYKGRGFKSIGIVSNKQGGFVYDPIAFNILLGNSETVDVRKRMNEIKLENEKQR